MRVGWLGNGSTNNSRTVVEVIVEFKKTVCWFAMCKIMPKGFEETMMFKGDDDKFESLYYELVTFASAKNSLRLDCKPVHTGARRERETKTPSKFVALRKKVESRSRSRARARMSRAGFATQLVTCVEDYFFNRRAKTKAQESLVKHRFCKMARRVVFIVEVISSLDITLTREAASQLKKGKGKNNIKGKGKNKSMHPVESNT